MVKPILFTTDMVRAILDDRKTVTRRSIPERILDKYYDYDEHCNCVITQDIPCTRIYEKEFFMNHARYQPEDILYVRETWQCWRAHRYEATADIMFRAGGDGVQIQFANGNTDYACREDYDKFVKKWFSYHGEWRPSIYMPKEAARIWLKVLDVRVEMLRDITDTQAIKEGFNGVRCSCGGTAYACTDCYNTGWAEPPLAGFIDTWNSTIKKVDADRYSWGANPWVWVIEFERCEKQEEGRA